jgi:glycopeptide antibiotics resistance protein
LRKEKVFLVKRIIFTGLAIVSAILYVYALYYLLFRLAGREMVIMSVDMLNDYNYRNAINLIPFKTTAEYIAAIIDGNIRGHAIRNLAGNLFLLFPLGFYLPFFARKTTSAKMYTAIVAIFIVIIEVMQLVTRSGILDIDDFILNFAGALIGFFIFTRNPIRSVFKLRAW